MPIRTYVPGQVQNSKISKKRGGGGGEKMTPQRGIQQKRGMELIKVVETALLFCFNRCQIDLLDKR